MKNATLVYLLLICCFLVLFGSCKNSGEKRTYVKKLERNKESIAVGVYKPNENDVIYTQEIIETLKIDGGIVAVSLNHDDMKRSKLENIDVLVFPEFRNRNKIEVDDEVAEIIRKFTVEKGKGIVCLGNSGKIFSLNNRNEELSLVPVKFIEQQPGETLNGIMKFELTEKGEKIFTELRNTQNLFIDFQSGPIIDLESNKEQLIGLVGKKSNSPVGIPFFVTFPSGKGRIFIATVHPEITTGMRWMVPRMVRWVIGRDLVSYDKNVVRPGFFKQEILIDENYRKEMDELNDLLTSGDKEQKIKAMDKLLNSYPWLAAEKVKELLSDPNEKVRLKVAEYLTKIEYTIAITDLEKAVKDERKRKVKEQLLAYENEMCNMIEQQVSVN
ncbi:MAG: HEAT repeat domain-containing protein [Bacteroidota bacterium]|nr:HEAT repeat domain-containing protein [Bacteroidota bacterium]